MRRLRWVVAIVGVLLGLAPAASAGEWTIQPVPSPVVHNGQLVSVSCTSLTACTAVGYGGFDDAYKTLAERWDGSEWSIQQMPIPADDALLNAVSCAASTSCMAVGFIDGGRGTLAELWNGVGWSVLSTPTVGDDGAVLSGVSCVSPTDCVAVGDYNVMSGGASDQYALAETWNGQTWSVQVAPSPSGGSNSQLAAVSCTSAAACTAVGSYENASYDGVPLAERWDGQAWSLQTVPSPTGLGSDGLAGVSCSSASACVAVGTGPFETPLAEGWDGAAWSIDATATPAGTSGGSLDDVSCTSSTSCIAVGNGTDETLAESFAGSSWSIQNTPSVDGAFFVGLNGISCVRAGGCIAVGAERVQDGASEFDVAEELDSGGWSRQSIPTPDFPDPGGLTSVSCPSMSFCAAVGDGGDSGAFAELWRDGAWSVMQIPTPADALNSDLSSVSCTSSDFCIAVGGYCSDSCQGGATLTELWNGSSWTIEPSPNIPGMNSRLGGVSCTAQNACTAVGSADSDVSMRQESATVAERWDGSSWSLQSVPSDSGLSSVSCTSATSCTAINSDAAETWDGTSWSAPVLAGSGPLSELSCIAGAACTAVGYDMPSDSTYDETLAEQFDGMSWSTQTTPSPNSQGARLYGVSCASATACTAIGYGNGTLVERWDGTTWSVQPSPNPSNTGASIPQLTAISCTQNTACVATGSGAAGSLVEQYVSGPATSVSVSLAPSTIAADGRSQTTVTALVSDAYGSRLSGDHVSFGSSDSGESIGPVTDNGDGSYTATITSSSTPGPVTITATDSSAAPEVSGRAVLTQAAIEPPTAQIMSPADNQTYTQGQVVQASYTCDEGAYGPGIQSCVGTVADGVAIDTAALGQHVFTVTATSTDGKSETSTSHYSVQPPGHHTTPGHHNNPDNHFTVSSVKAHQNGATDLLIIVPGPGTLDLVETAWIDTAARTAQRLHLAPHRFVIARKHINTSRAGKIQIRLSLNRRGQSLVRGRRLRFTLGVSYTPMHGRQRNISIHGLHFGP